MAVSEIVLDFIARVGVVATGILQRDDAVSPVVHRIAPQTKNYMAQKSNSAKAKKPWSNRLGLKSICIILSPHSRTVMTIFQYH